MSFSGGVFSINTAGQPVVAGTTISSSVFNAFTADIATGLSTCILKDGTQTATAGIGFFAGTVSLPGIYLGSDSATGLYRIGLNNTGFAINGTKLLDLSSGAIALVGTLALGTSGMTVTGTSAAWGFGVAPSAWSQGKAVEAGFAGNGIWSATQTDFRLTNNYYFNSADLFAGSGYASFYGQAAGVHTWKSSSATGTAGNAATMVTTMSLSTAGVLTLSNYGSGGGVVTVGGADSGGAGFRLLRVPN